MAKQRKRKIAAAGEKRRARNPRRIASPLWEAQKHYETYLRLAWEHGYRDAIEEAVTGDPTRLNELLSMADQLELPEKDRRLAEFVARKTVRKGRPREDAVRETARLATTLLTIYETQAARGAVIEVACVVMKKKYGTDVDPEQVHEMLRRPLNRRR